MRRSIPWLSAFVLLLALVTPAAAEAPAGEAPPAAVPADGTAPAAEEAAAAALAPLDFEELLRPASPAREAGSCWIAECPGGDPAVCPPYPGTTSVRCWNGCCVYGI